MFKYEITGVWSFARGNLIFYHGVSFVPSARIFIEIFRF